MPSIMHTIKKLSIIYVDCISQISKYCALILSIFYDIYSALQNILRDIHLVQYLHEVYN